MPDTLERDSFFTVTRAGGGELLSAGADRPVELHADADQPAHMAERLALGRSYDEEILVAGRAGGATSPAHQLASIIAAEQAFGVDVPQRATKLRELMMLASYIEAHSMHIYTKVAPDYFGGKSFLDIRSEDPEAYRRGRDIHAVGAKLLTAVAGRVVHPTAPAIGGFNTEPSRQELLRLAAMLDSIAGDAEATCEMVRHFEIPQMHTSADYLALVEKGAYPLLGTYAATLLSPAGYDVGALAELLEEEPGAIGCPQLLLPGIRPIMVGPLARVNHAWANMSQRTRVMAAKAGVRPVCSNTYRIVYCEALEMLEAAADAAVLCRELADEDGEILNASFEVREGVGAGAAESPQGLVIHVLSYNARGRVIRARYIASAMLNARNLAADLAAIPGTRGSEDMKRDAARLMRAVGVTYSCSGA